MAGIATHPAAPRAAAALVVTLALAAATSCARATEHPERGASGIEGIATIGPTCPVEHPGSPCPDRPFATTLAVTNADGEPVATIETGDDGRFRIELPPGDYVVRPASTAGPRSAQPQPVTVPPGAYAGVTIRFDSGIR